jgi:uncharacterized SAM-binding protein YcdF (DUF218 family)
VTYLEPALPLLLLIGLVGLANAWRNSTRGRRPWLLTVCIVGIFLLSLNAVACLFALPLEIWYPEKPFPQESAEAIVILAGAAHQRTGDRPYTFPRDDTYERLQHGIWLFKHWKAVPILVCGGAFSESQEPYSTSMRRVLESEGIPADLIWVDDRSRSTHENAVYGGGILREHAVTRIALIVEASSMPRAAASFRKNGITVVPAPIRFNELDRTFKDVFPDWHALASNGETLHEYVGLAWYRMRGWI